MKRLAEVIVWLFWWVILWAVTFAVFDLLDRTWRVR